MGDDFDYVKAFNSINYDELKQDVIRLMLTHKIGGSRLWPLRPFMIRMA